MAATSGSPRLLLVSLGLLSLSAAFTNVGFPPLLLEVAREFDISVGTAGVAVAAYGLPGIAVVLIAGPLSDRYGRWRFLLAGATTIGIGAIGTAFAPTFAWVVACRAIAGIGAALCFANVLAVVGDSVPYSERGRAVAVVIGIQTFAAVVGIPVSGIIADLWGWRPVLLVMAGIAGTAGVLAHIAVPRTRGVSTAGPPYRLYARVVTDAPALAILAIGFLGGLAWSTWASYFVPFLQTVYGTSLSFASTVSLTTGIGMFIGTQLGGRIGDRLGHPRMMGFGLIAAAFALFALAWSGNALAVAAALHAVLAVSSGVRLSTHSALISDLMPQSRSTLLAVYAAATSASLTLGAYVGGKIVDAYGFSALALFCGAAMLLSAPILAAFVRARHDAVAVAPGA
jgi:predicted MFS family arabinose efflux permease